MDGYGWTDVEERTHERVVERVELELELERVVARRRGMMNDE